jgi:type IV secretion system protein VirB4
MYRKLGLNDKQIRIIAGLMPKRDYYVVQPLGKRVIQLALGKVALRWLGVSSTEQVQRLRRLINDEPKEWRTLWVKAA